nr:hypothetical protein [Nannocystis sp.]
MILSGLPIWFVFAILVSLAPEMGAALGLDPAPNAAYAVLWAYVGIALGDLASGTLSQLLRSRRKVMALFIGLTAVTRPLPRPRRPLARHLLCHLRRRRPGQRLLGGVRHHRLGTIRHQPACHR